MSFDYIGLKLCIRSNEHLLAKKFAINGYLIGLRETILSATF